MLPTHTISTSYDKKRPYFGIYIHHVTSLLLARQRQAMTD